MQKSPSSIIVAGKSAGLSHSASTAWGRTKTRHKGVASFMIHPEFQELFITWPIGLGLSSGDKG